VLPDLGQFFDELLIVLDMPKLIRILVITLENPIWGRGHNQVD